MTPDGSPLVPKFAGGESSCWMERRRTYEPARAAFSSYGVKNSGSWN